MLITDLNAAGGIGANCHYVELGAFRVVIDSGLHPKRLGLEALPEFHRIEDNSLDFVILTHSHLDHLGSLPVLMRRQQRAQVILTPATRILAERMMHNSCNVMKRQREEFGVPQLPLYTHGEVSRLEKLLFPLPFAHKRTFSIEGESVDITLHASGHIAGAAGCELVYRHRRILFTGDVLFTPQRTIGGAELPQGPVDTLVMETTRGATERSPGTDRETEGRALLDFINRVIARGGSVLIPAFALGRMQEMLMLLNEARREHRLPGCPIYCSGLGVSVADHYDEIARRNPRVHFRRRVMKELNVKPLPDHIRPGRAPRESAIYLVSSGMMVENTPSYHVAAALLENGHNGIAFVGYCDPDTAGGRLRETPQGERFDFETLDYSCPVNAEIVVFDLSSHADREELLEYARQTEARSIVLSHGDPEARDWFMDEINEGVGNSQVIDPEPLVTTEV